MTEVAKRTGDFYAGVRKRGQLNALLDEVALAYQTAHPDQRCKWEFAPPSGDMSMIVMREAQGLKVVDASEFGNLTASQQKTGPMRRGDLILMAGPKEVLDEMDRADAELADESVNLAETTYKEHMERQQYRLSDGAQLASKGIGTIRRTFEEVPIPESKGGETR